MRKLPFAQSVGVTARGTVNWVRDRPIVVSFEVTDACTCYCRHCDHGGPRDTSRNMKPADYRRYMRALRPCAVQISGGEPLMRDDLTEIVRHIKQPLGLPYLILVSNWSLMTLERYVELREAGVNQFSISLDFPDDRHDAFRGHPGLYGHLADVVPRAAKLGYDDIVMNTCITSENVEEINRAADQAREWGVNISFSAYSPRRTGDHEYFLRTPEQLAALSRELDRIKARMDGTHWIANSCATIDATRRYFENGGTPGCKAGLRFLVVTADGQLQPCSMQFRRYPLAERARLVEEFTRKNTCDECYVSIRSYLDKSFLEAVKENVGGFFSFRPNREPAPADSR